MVRILLRSPTGDATAPPTFSQSPRLLASCRSFLHVRLVSDPTTQITVHPEWSQNVLRSLHQQRSQVGVAFLADMQLRLALSRVPAPRLQSQIAAQVAALAAAMRIFPR